ncbi:hypothetical protein ACC760_39700, partial [Rhizobium ruizarguesonis]
VIVLGFTDFELGYGKFRFVGFENYAHLITDRTFRKSLWNTTVYTAIVAPFSILLGGRQMRIKRVGLKDHGDVAVGGRN